MKKFALSVVEKLILERDLRLPEERSRLGILEAWFSIIGNLTITLIKFFCGIFIGSISLLADAVHSASDVFSSGVVLIGFRASKKGPDANHPHGHGRIEYLTGLVISLMLVGAGISFIFTSYERLTTGSVIQPHLLAIFSVLLTIVIKEFLFHFSYAAGEKIDSEALMADAMHHRSDSLTTIAVLIAIIGAYFNLEFLDALFGFLVAGFVIFSGAQIAYKSINRLLGAAPCEETRANLLDSILNTHGVINAHDLEVHDYGAQKSITVHIEVNGDLSVNEAHDIADRVENNLREQNKCHAVVHLDPYEKNSGKKTKNKDNNKPLSK